MKIAIASKRKAKIEAVRAAVLGIASLGISGWEKVEFITREVHSDAPATPTSDEDLMRGARTRARNLVRLLASERVEADLFIGLEGGLHVARIARRRVVFLRGWVYACDRAGGEGRFGCSPSIEVTREIAEAVLDRGEDLGDVIDRLSGRVDVKSNEGTWGVLTRDLITRERSFEMATLAALAPYYNSSIF